MKTAYQARAINSTLPFIVDFRLSVTKKFKILSHFQTIRQIAIDPTFHEEVKMLQRNHCYQLFVAIAILFLPSFVGAQTAEPLKTASPYVPSQDGKWESVTAKIAGADPHLLKQAMKFAGQKNSKGVVVLWKGRILSERYWDGWTKDSIGPINSATKSLVSTLVGMAIESGHIEGVEQSCSDFLDEWKFRPRYRRINIEHLLSMNSGLKNSKRIFLAGLLVKDERAFATRLPIAYPPGEHWDYHNSAYKLLFPILEEATGVPLDQYTDTKLFSPLGMEQARWRPRHNNKKKVNLMEMSARDAARYGLLVLRNGKWGDDQLISSQWLAKSTQPTFKEVNSSYGNLWWLNGGTNFYLPLIDKPQKGPIFPSVPNDAFAALGKDDQKIYVIPSLDLVITRLGDKATITTAALSDFDAQFLAMICGSF